MTDDLAEMLGIATISKRTEMFGLNFKVQLFLFKYCEMIEIRMESLFTHHCPHGFQERKRCGLQNWSWES